MNFLLLDACAFIPKSGSKLLLIERESDEARLFATSKGFLNGTALTHLSANIVTNILVENIYHPHTRRGTLTFLNRLRMIIVVDNDQAYREREEREQLDKKLLAKAQALRERLDFDKQMVAQKGKKGADKKKKLRATNLWGQTKPKTEEELKKEAEAKAKEEAEAVAKAAALAAEKINHPPLFDQIKTIVECSSRIETLIIKWKDMRVDDINRQVNDAFAHFQHLHHLRKLTIGLCCLDYTRFVEHLPPLIEELTFSETYHSSYKPVLTNVEEQNMRKIAHADPISRKKPRYQKYPLYGNDDDDDDDSAITSNDDDSSNDSYRYQYARRGPPTRNLAGASQLPHGKPRYTKFHQDFQQAICAKLPRLKILRFISANMLGDADFSQLNNHPTLTSIIINNNERFQGRKSFKPESIPARLLHFRLTRCDLAGDIDFSKFPPNLVNINLSQNDFRTKKPIEFSTLPINTQVLNLSNTDIKIGYPLNNLPPGLRVLDLSATSCALNANFEDNFASLPENLQILKLRYLRRFKQGSATSKMTMVPPPLRFESNLDNLRVLDLGGTTLRGKPIALNQLPPLLQVLNLCHCHCSFWYPGQKEIQQNAADVDKAKKSSKKHLVEKELDLGALNCRDTILIMKISNNKICGTFKMSSKLPQLKILNVSDCEISMFDFSTNNSNSGSDDSRVPTWCSASPMFPPKLKHLKLCGNALKPEHSQIFDLSLLPNSLTVLEMSRCGLTGAPNFSQLPLKIRKIDLSHNFLSTEEDFYNNSNIKSSQPAAASDDTKSLENDERRRKLLQFEMDDSEADIPKIAAASKQTPPYPPLDLTGLARCPRLLSLRMDFNDFLNCPLLLAVPSQMLLLTIDDSRFIKSLSHVDISNAKRIKALVSWHVEENDKTPTLATTETTKYSSRRLKERKFHYDSELIYNEVHDGENYGFVHSESETWIESKLLKGDTSDDEDDDDVDSDDDAVSVDLQVDFGGSEWAGEGRLEDDDYTGANSYSYSSSGTDDDETWTTSSDDDDEEDDDDDDDDDDETDYDTDTDDSDESDSDHPRFVTTRLAPRPKRANTYDSDSSWEDEPTDEEEDY